MTEPTFDDRTLNLEADSFDDLQRELQLGSDGAESTPPLQGPQIAHRCDSAHRELLRNPFPPVDE